MLSAVTIFGSWRKEAVGAYASQVVEGQRVVVEKNGENVKVRYEKVIRDGYDEIVKVVAPEPFEWAYLNGKTYVVLGDHMKLSPATIVDAERLFIKTLASTLTEISTSSVTYNGRKACEVTLQSTDATYEGVFLLPSMLLVKLSIQREKKDLSISYNQIKVIDKTYFNFVLGKFKISNTPPSPMEVEIWKIVYHLEKVSIKSISVNNITLVVIDGVAPEIGDVIAYLFKKSEKLSASSLSVQFKSRGITTINAEHNGVIMLFASNTKAVDKFKKWVKKILK